MKKNLFDVDSNEIKRIINLHEERSKSQYLNLTEASNKGSYENPYTDVELQPAVDTLVTKLDGATLKMELQTVLTTLEKYKGKVAVDKSDYYNPKKISAIYRIRQLYKLDEGDNIIDDVKAVDAFDPQTTTLKSQIVSILSNYNKNVVLKKAEKKVEKKVTKVNHKYGSISIPAGSTFKKYNNKYVLLYTPNKQKIWYNCDDKTFSNGGQWVKGDGKLEYTLHNDVTACNRGQKPPSNNTPPPSNDDQKKKVVDPNNPLVVDPTKVPVVDPNLTPAQQEFVNKTATSIQNIQSLIGSPQTGKVDTAQLQTLIDKLNAKQ